MDVYGRYHMISLEPETYKWGGPPCTFQHVNGKRDLIKEAQLANKSMDESNETGGLTSR